jgi:hypothetical protein
MAKRIKGHGLFALSAFGWLLAVAIIVTSGDLIILLVRATSG